MKTIFLAFALVMGIFAQTVGGQASASGQTANFTIKAKKAPKLAIQTVSCACVAPNCSTDPLDGAVVLLPGTSTTCTVTITLTPPSPIPSNALITLLSSDTTQITVPPSVTFPACALTPCSTTFDISATP